MTSKSMIQKQKGPQSVTACGPSLGTYRPGFSNILGTLGEQILHDLTGFGFLRPVAAKKTVHRPYTGTNPDSYPPETGDQSLTFPHYRSNALENVEGGPHR